jgi:HlyD family secretion protein
MLAPWRAAPNLRRWGLRAAAVTAVALGIVALRWTFFRPDPVPVQVERVVRGRVEQTVTNSRAGTVKARRRAKLSPQEGGRIVALPQRKGDRVKAGEVLLELDSSIQRARLDLARREQQSAVAERTRACLAGERAARELTRNRRLAHDGIVSTDLLDQIESASRTAAAACDAARANEQKAAAAIDPAERELAHMTLRAPFDGVVADLSIEVGGWPPPSPPIVHIPSVVDVIDTSSIYVSAPMDEVDSSRIRPALEARVTIDSHPGKHFRGRVTRLAAYVLDVEEQNRTVEIDVELDDATFAATLLPGTSADVEVVLDRKDGVMRVPAAALLSGDRVLVVDGGRLVERSVDVGIRNWDAAEIVSGLREGEAVVVSLDRPEGRVACDPAHDFRFLYALADVSGSRAASTLS